MDYSVFLQKPFQVTTFNWSTVDPVGAIATRCYIPSDVFDKNEFLAAPFRNSCFYRARARLHLQVAGTPMHMGILIAAVMPAGTPTTSFTGINNLLAAPHCFLYANQATPAVIEIPFYYGNTIKPTEMITEAMVTDVLGHTLAPYAELQICNLNQLETVSGSITLTVIVSCEFTELEFYVPKVNLPRYLETQGFVTTIRTATTQAIDGVTNMSKKYTGDLIDATRELFRSYTGLHNPNIRTVDKKIYKVSRNNFADVEGETYIESMYPFCSSRLTDKLYFKTSVDEMDINFMLSKPYYIGTFRISVSDPVGTLCFARPITPLMENGPTLTTMLSKFALMSSYWSGDLELIIQSSMTNLQYCKLLVSKDYSRQTLAMTSFLSFNDVVSLQADQIEFSGGGTCHSVVLPFQSDFRQLPISYLAQANALSHGIFRIHLVQPLVVSPQNPTNASFNVFVRARPNFKFYGTSNYLFTDPLVVANSQTIEMAKEEKKHVLERRNSYVKLPVIKNSPRTLETQSEMSVINTSSDQNCLSEPVVKDEVLEDFDMRPNTSVRDYVRRFYHVSSFEMGSLDYETSRKVIPIAPLLGFNSVNPELTPLAMIQRLYFGFRGGLKIKVRCRGLFNASLYYIPPIPYRTSSSIHNALYTSSPTSTPNISAFDTRFIYEALTQPHPVDFPITQIELPNYHSAPNDLPSNGIVAGNRTLEIEAYIPYLNPMDFVGSNNKMVPLSNTVNYNNSLGYLVLVANSHAAPTLRLGVVDLYVAVSDESRYGMAIYNPPMELLKSSSDQVVSIINDPTNGTPTNIAQGVPSFYYTKTT